MSNILEKLFGSGSKTRILRICMRNPDDVFTVKDLARRTKLSMGTAKKEIEQLVKLDIAGKKIIRLNEEVATKKKKKKGKQRHIKIKIKSRKALVYFANKQFELFQELYDLITKATSTPKREIASKIKTFGNVKFALISGVFINHPNARTDLLIVGDKISVKKIHSFLSKMESDLGKPIHYTLMETSEFKYRMNMYDRFLRDILEAPHEKIVNRINV